VCKPQVPLKVATDAISSSKLCSVEKPQPEGWTLNYRPQLHQSPKAKRSPWACLVYQMASLRNMSTARKAMRPRPTRTPSCQDGITFPQRGQRRREVEYFWPQRGHALFLDLWGWLPVLCRLRVGMTLHWSNCFHLSYASLNGSHNYHRSV
jgi:hypothetical protein